MFLPGYQKCRYYGIYFDWWSRSYRHLYYCRNFAKLRVCGCFEHQPTFIKANAVHYSKFCVGKVKVVQLLYVTTMVGIISPGLPLERVRPHPLKSSNGCAAPVLKIQMFS